MKPMSTYLPKCQNLMKWENLDEKSPLYQMLIRLEEDRCLLKKGNIQSAGVRNAIFKIEEALLHLNQVINLRMYFGVDGRDDVLDPTSDYIGSQITGQDVVGGAQFKIKLSIKDQDTPMEIPFNFHHPILVKDIYNFFNMFYLPMVEYRSNLYFLIHRNEYNQVECLELFDDKILPVIEFFKKYIQENTEPKIRLMIMQAGNDIGTIHLELPKDAFDANVFENPGSQDSFRKIMDFSQKLGDFAQDNNCEIFHSPYYGDTIVVNVPDADNHISLVELIELLDELKFK